MPPRDLRVLVDRDTVPDSHVVLELLLKQAGMTVEQYKDDGPPANVTMSPDGFMPPTAIGWVTVGPAADVNDPLSGRSVRTATDGTVSESSLLEITVGYLRLVLNDMDGHDVSDESAVLFAVARELHVDLLITAREDLLNSALAHGEMQIRTAAGAIPLLALYLRGTEGGVIAISPNLTETVTPASHYFYRVAGEYLPLLDATEERLRTDGAVSEVQLVQALRRKLGFALMRRDTVWRLTLQHPTSAQLEEIAAEVDAFLLFLTSAMDALARLIDEVLDLRTHRTNIGFQKETWRQKVADKGSLAFDEHHVNVATAITGLRNFTHGTGTRALPIDVGKHDWKKTTTYVLYERLERLPDEKLARSFGCILGSPRVAISHTKCRYVAAPRQRGCIRDAWSDVRRARRRRPRALGSRSGRPRLSSWSRTGRKRRRSPDPAAHPHRADSRVHSDPRLR